MSEQQNDRSREKAVLGKERRVEAVRWVGLLKQALAGQLLLVPLHAGHENEDREQ